MTLALADAVIHALRSVCPDPNVTYGLHEPLFGGNEASYVRECVETGWVSSVGAFVDRFEADLARAVGVRGAIATVNGTAALHMCLQLGGVQPGDEVLVPALTFVGTVNPVRYCGAVPHFVDSEERTLGVDPGKLLEYLGGMLRPGANGPVNARTGRAVRALVPVHTFGHPVDLDAIAEVCQKFDLVLIEDAAESIGSYYKGRHTGTFGRLAAMSFNGNKTLTTGGGGAVLTDDDALAARTKHLTTTAKTPHRWAFNHDAVGYNYRMPNINAALGCAQLEQLPGFIEAKRALACRYRAAFAGLEGIRVFEEPSFARSNYWLNVALLEEESEEARDELLEAAHQARILARPAWTLMHKLPMYQDCPRMDLSAAESLERRLINLPSGVRLMRGTQGGG